MLTTKMTLLFFIQKNMKDISFQIQKLHFVLPQLKPITYELPKNCVSPLIVDNVLIATADVTSKLFIPMQLTDDFDHTCSEK